MISSSKNLLTLSDFLESLKENKIKTSSNLA